MTTWSADGMIPVILCIDVEPNSRRPKPRSSRRWTGFERTFNYISRLRDRLRRSTAQPVHLNWFLRLDPQIEMAYGSPAFVLERYGSLIDQIQRAGDEVGIHPHAWRWDPHDESWYVDYEDPAWALHCLDLSLETYRMSIGRPCESLRFGDRYMSNELMNRAEAAGILRDLTLEPGEHSPASTQRERIMGRVPDYRPVARFPFTPSREDFRTPAQGSARTICTIPLSSGDMRADLLPVLRWVRRRLTPYGGIPAGFGTLRLWEPAQIVWGAIDRLLQEGAAYLAFAVRSDVTLRWPLNLSFDENLERFAAHPLRSRFKFVTAKEALSLLKCAEPAA